jgi:hypothetical protein
VELRKVVVVLEKELKDKESSRNHWQSKCGELEVSVKHLAEIANDKYPQEIAAIKEKSDREIMYALPYAPKWFIQRWHEMFTDIAEACRKAWEDGYDACGKHRIEEEGWAEVKSNDSKGLVAKDAKIKDLENAQWKFKYGNACNQIKELKAANTAMRPAVEAVVKNKICLNCGNKMVKKDEHIWYCLCSPEMRLSVG